MGILMRISSGVPGSAGGGQRNPRPRGPPVAAQAADDGRRPDALHRPCRSRFARRRRRVRDDQRRSVAVRAAREPLVEVRAEDARHLARLAWHRQPASGGGGAEGRLLIGRDHVIEAMLAGLGARLALVEEPFEPESGAYGSTATPTRMDDGLGKLFAWLSPAYPVGAFTYSHGLEWAVQAGDVRDFATLTAWIADVLQHGARPHRRDTARLRLPGRLARATPRHWRRSRNWRRPSLPRPSGCSRPPPSARPSPRSRPRPGAADPGPAPYPVALGGPWRSIGSRSTTRRRSTCRPSPATWCRPGLGSASPARPTRSGRSPAAATRASYAPGKGSDPEVVARAVRRAVDTDRPRTRYVVGKYARTLITLRRWSATASSNAL